VGSDACSSFKARDRGRPAVAVWWVAGVPHSPRTHSPFGVLKATFRRRGCRRGRTHRAGAQSRGLRPGHQPADGHSVSLPGSALTNASSPRMNAYRPPAAGRRRHLQHHSESAARAGKPAQITREIASQLDDSNAASVCSSRSLCVQLREPLAQRLECGAEGAARGRSTPFAMALCTP